MVGDIPFVRMGADRFPIRPLFGPSLGVEVSRAATPSRWRAKPSSPAAS